MTLKTFLLAVVAAAALIGAAVIAVPTTADSTGEIVHFSIKAD